MLILIRGGDPGNFSNNTVVVQSEFILFMENNKKNNQEQEFFAQKIKEQESTAEEIVKKIMALNAKTNWEKLRDGYLKISKNKEFSGSQRKQLEWMIQIDFLFRYFIIAFQYLDKDDIQKRVEKEYPSWTGYENQYWIFYHYEAYCNFLYAYLEALGAFLREFFSINGAPNLSKIAEDPRVKSIITNQTTKETMGDLITNFINNEFIKEIVDERTEVVHKYGLPRFVHKEPYMQKWDELIKKMTDKIKNANKVIGDFHNAISAVILKQTEVN